MSNPDKSTFTSPCLLTHRGIAISSRAMITVEDLPHEVLRWILSFVDIPTLCTIYTLFEHQTIAAPTLDVLTHTTIPVLIDSLVTIDGIAADANKLLEMPSLPIEVMVLPTVWHKLPFFLEKYTPALLSMELGPRWGRTIPDMKQLQISELTLDQCIVEVARLPLSVAGLRILGGSLDLVDFLLFSQLKLLEISDEVDVLNATEVLLPPSTTLLYLPADAPCNTLDRLEEVLVGFSEGLPWCLLKTLQLLLLEGCDPNLELLVTVDMLEVNPPFSSLHCPNLKRVCIDDEGEKENYGEIDTMFTPCQLSQLEQLYVPDYTIGCFDAFTNLVELGVTLVDGLHADTPIPTLVRRLDICTRKSVTWVPPSVSRFTVEAPTVTISLKNLRDLYLVKCTRAAIDGPNVLSLGINDMEYEVMNFATLPVVTMLELMLGERTLENTTIKGCLSDIKISCHSISNCQLVASEMITVSDTRDIAGTEFVSPIVTIDDSNRYTHNCLFETTGQLTVMGCDRHTSMPGVEKLVLVNSFVQNPLPPYLVLATFDGCDFFGVLNNPVIVPNQVEKLCVRQLKGDFCIAGGKSLATVILESNLFDSFHIAVDPPAVEVVHLDWESLDYS